MAMISNVGKSPKNRNRRRSSKLCSQEVHFFAISSGTSPTGSIKISHFEHEVEVKFIADFIFACFLQESSLYKIFRVECFIS